MEKEMLEQERKRIYISGLCLFVNEMLNKISKLSFRIKVCEKILKKIDEIQTKQNIKTSNDLVTSDYGYLSIMTLEQIDEKEKELEKVFVDMVGYINNVEVLKEAFKHYDFYEEKNKELVVSYIRSKLRELYDKVATYETQDLVVEDDTYEACEFNYGIDDNPEDKSLN